MLPEGANNVHYEAELVVVIGKQARNVTPAEAPKYIFGITAGNDVSERDWQKNDLQWFRAKGCDTFGTLGPCIVTGLNYSDLLVESRVNGEVRQSSNTRYLILGVPELIAYASSFYTLNPGDVIITGTPEGVSPIQPGDVITACIEQIGTMEVNVRAASTDPTYQTDQTYPTHPT